MWNFKASDRNSLMMQLENITSVSSVSPDLYMTDSCRLWRPLLNDKKAKKMPDNYCTTIYSVKLQLLFPRKNNQKVDTYIQKVWTRRMGCPREMFGRWKNWAVQLITSIQFPLLTADYLHMLLITSLWPELCWNMPNTISCQSCV